MVLKKNFANWKNQALKKSYKLFVLKIILERKVFQSNKMSKHSTFSFLVYMMKEMKRQDIIKNDIFYKKLSKIFVLQKALLRQGFKSLKEFEPLEELVEEETQEVIARRCFSSCSGEPIQRQQISQEGPVFEVLRPSEVFY